MRPNAKILPVGRSLCLHAFPLISLYLVPLPLAVALCSATINAGVAEAMDAVCGYLPYVGDASAAVVPSVPSPVATQHTAVAVLASTMPSVLAWALRLPCFTDPMLMRVSIAACHLLDALVRMTSQDDLVALQTRMLPACQGDVM